MKDIRIKDFKVNEEAKVVVGTGLFDTQLETDMEHSQAPGKIRELVTALDNLFIGTPFHKVKVKARCDERDAFDWKRGKDICNSKLECKRHMKLARKYDRVYRMMCEALPYVEERVRTHLGKAQAIQEDLGSMYRE